ncbi:TetR/AcrR family transcriptional regulator [Endozoicomonas sp. SCSIO W0465]|uniref:TetR/AcrR family transcriptional regulator n=1 Tax=Endozoicomonas sp. SCSIO W0465 TaxID=2918516 RepID=UPI00207666CF|nr:TetR/AcrR family transcriptional regulator [Endozoicomonas sp. SCSIO W0465]USE35774.1 TetR/AcrR family transcriptional regulator [Endozoicomonas sp. SCSIO W0465]
MEAVAKKYRPGKIRENNKKSILAAAEQEFVAHGFKGATMQRIAQRANLPKANVHYYFSNKLSLYAAVLSNILKLWDQSFDRLSPEDDPEEALAAYIHTKIMFSRKNPLASRIFAQEVINGGPHLTAYFGEDYREWFRDRAQVFKAWSDQGKMAPVDPVHLIFLLWSSTQHYADFSYQITRALGKDTLGQSDYDQATETLTRIILKGLDITSDQT